MRELHPQDLATDDAWKLLASIGFGRVVFTRHALPVIRPTNHLVDGETLIIHDNLAADHQTVAYEADTLDHTHHTGWCVIVTGTTEPVTDPTDITHYRHVLHPSLPGPRHRLARIHPDHITGIEYLVPRVGVHQPALPTDGYPKDQAPQP
ncbi:pyridoxamine 5'-phosphate oxidase family protein [Nocardia otitidiscaviarum]|uniref:pyridoxamine 5'-phosphate oxidase family protein n=1 Tax=Nocardia otitidiscaviarum TaxID=1823 RepID=UPI0024572C0E|nr:pyridoxamine 5'-phosphate oxidase family protein [Nocardia otitidiscaviarum]